MDDDIHEDQTRWEMLRLDLVEVLGRSEQSDTAMISATLRALLDSLTNDMSLEDAKARISRALSMFREDLNPGSW